MFPCANFVHGCEESWGTVATKRFLPLNPTLKSSALDHGENGARSLMDWAELALACMVLGDIVSTGVTMHAFKEPVCVESCGWMFV